MAAGIDDLLTTQKNAVVGLNNLTRTIQAGQGVVTSATVTSATQVTTGGGTLVSISVLVAGTTTGFVHNSPSTGAAVASNAMVAAPNTIGVYHAGTVFSAGLTIIPGTGQSVCVTYSPA
jgi:hypothetical protein